MAVPKFITNDMEGGYVGGPTTPARRCYVGGTLVYQGFGPAAEQEFIRQEAAGGPAQLLKVYGKTIVWNHGGGVRNTGPEVYGITRTKISDNLIRVSGTSTQQTNFTLSATFSTIAGHIYMTILSEVPQGCTPSATRFTGNGSNTNIGLIIPVGVSVDAEISCHWFDLTLMYGAGDEPASIASFLADHPDALTASYDPGSLQSNKTAELRAYDGGTLRGSLALNLSTLTGKLNGEGASVVVYPDGLRGVGNIRDEAEGSTAVQRIGSRAYQSGDESDPDVITDGTYTFYALATPLTYTLDTPLPTDLTCEQGDILQRVSDNNCPFVGEMRFGL